MIGTRHCILIAGSRGYPDLSRVRTFVKGIRKSGKIVVSGGARGIDTAAILAARFHGMSHLVIEAQWETQGKRAGMLRNLDMLEVADEVVAFWDLESRGTRHTIEKARGRGLPTLVFGPDGREMS